MYPPLVAAVAWLAGTFLLFLIVGDVRAVPNLFGLSAYVAFTIVCLMVGYWLRVLKYRGQPVPALRPTTAKDIRQIKTLATLSGFYYVLYGITYLSIFGFTSPSAVFSAVSNPGSSYIRKFEIFDNQLAGGGNNAGAQLLTITAVLAAPLVPFVVVYFKHLTGDIRVLAALGVGLYATVFLAIGTLVGLGSILIFAGVSYMVVRARTERAGTQRRWPTILVTAAVLLFLGYMSYNQSARIQEVGIAGEYEPNPVVETFASDAFARGVTVTAFYPTHGYLGLAYNMETPFVWTGGRGAARALDSYMAQYGIADSVSSRTYPQRTENRMGWDAGIYWSTIYPWLASDLRYSGAALFMGLVGWWLARFWYEAVALGRKLSLLLLCQLGVLIAYVPANNQLGLSRPNLICVVTLLVLYLFRRRSEEPAGGLEVQNDVRRRGDVRAGVVVDRVGDGVSRSDLSRDGQPARDQRP